MTRKDKTLWMGNIEPWMTKFSLISILNKMKIFPTKINIKKFPNKRSCAFLEFLSHEIAEDILQRFNGKYINNIELKFNWVKKSEDKNKGNKTKKSTVNIYLFNIFLQLFVGNIDKSITEEELKKYFFERYSSIIRLQLMKNIETNKSKGYAFIDFSNFDEFQKALNNGEQVILGKQKLFFDSAKNKYDNNLSFYKSKFNELNDFCNYNKNDIAFNEDNNFYKSYYIANKENILNFQDKNRFFNIRSPIIERKNKFILSPKQEIKKKEIFINNKDFSINDQIKYSLQNLAINYSSNNNFLKSKLCNYYCGPFLEKNIFGFNKNLFNENV